MAQFHRRFLFLHPSVCFCHFRRGAGIAAVHAEAEPVPARGGRPVRERLRDDAHVLPLAELHADRPLRAQPPRPHQQRELLLHRVGQPARAQDVRRVPQPGRIQDW